MHIGLIGGIGPASTAYYYRELADAHASAGRRMELTIAHAELRDLIQHTADGAAERQAQIYLRLARRLQAAGAEAIAVTSIGGHFCIDELIARCPLPVINVLPALDAELRRRRLTRVGVLGTAGVMQSRVYGGIASVTTVVPEGDSFEAVHRDYVAMAIAGRASEEQRTRLFAAGRDLCQRQGAEAVILGGTDLFLAFEGAELDFPVIDGARVHIDALYRASIGQA